VTCAHRNRRIDTRVALSTPAAKMLGRSTHVKTCIICNPGAGSVDDGADALEQLRAAAAPADVRLTRNSGEATRFAHEAVDAGYDVVVAAGGDGTLNEVVNGVAPHIDRVRVGLIPLGTGNDFARVLNLPDSVDGCIEVLRSGHTKAVDLVRVTSDQVRYFINVSAGGFSGTVDEKLTPEIKKTWGPLAYVRSAAEALPELRAYRTRIVLDDMAPPLEFDLYNAIIANGRYVAGGTPVAPDALVDDGLLDIVLVPQRPMSEIAVMAAQMLIGKHLASDAIVFRRAAKISINSSPGMWFNVDGEIVGNEPATFEVLPRALQFLAPDES
jgi:diacylglycerol kinase (ATP)